MFLTVAGSIDFFREYCGIISFNGLDFQRSLQYRVYHQRQCILKCMHSQGQAKAKSALKQPQALLNATIHHNFGRRLKAD